MKGSRLRRNPEQRRIVEQQPCAGNWQIQRRQRNLLVAFVVPCCRLRKIKNLYRERRRLVPSTRFFQRQQQAAVRRLTRTNRPARQRNAPHRCSRGQGNFHKVALVISDRVACLDQFFPVGAHQHLVASLFYVGQQDRLLVVARDVYAQRPCRAGFARPSTKRNQSGRLPVRDHLAEVGGVGIFKPLRFLIFDLAGSEDFDRHSSRVAFRIQ